MCYKLSSVLTLIVALAVAKGNSVSGSLIQRWKFPPNATHKPVIPEGGNFPFRNQALPLSAIIIDDNGLVEIPAPANILARNEVKTNTSTTNNTDISSTSTTTTPATGSPQPLPLSHPKCGIVNTRIVNGVQTVRNEYPWMVWTTLKWSNGKQRRCGGSIIHEQWILTAAHCPYMLNSAQTALYYPSSISVAVGAYNKDNPGAHGGYTVEADVKNIYLHPKLQMPYDIALYKDVRPWNVNYSDVEHRTLPTLPPQRFHTFTGGSVGSDPNCTFHQLLQLKRPLVFTHRVAPVCLAPRQWENEYFVNISVIASGWGKTETGSLATYLRKYETVGYDLDACALIYGDWIGPTQMCTDGSAKKHTCSGDSGGPVMKLAQGRAFQVGVVSFGSGNCKDTLPDGQVRVAPFIDWFQSVTNVTFNI